MNFKQTQVDNGKFTNESEGFQDKEFPDKWPSRYSEDYRHFDTLIWQTPVISSAIFAITIGAIAEKGKETVVLSFLLLSIVSLIFCTNYYILYRWRIHQQYTERYDAPGLHNKKRKRSQGVPKKTKGGQYYLQLSTGLLVIFTLGLFVFYFINLFFYIITDVVCLKLIVDFYCLKIVLNIVLDVGLIIGLILITRKVDKDVLSHQKHARELKKLANLLINPNV